MSRSISRHRPFTIPLDPRVFVTRICAMAVAFAVAFALDMATNQRFSAYWGSGAIMASVLVVIPAARRMAVPVGAYALVWIGFNLMRAVADDGSWPARHPDAVARAESWLAGGTLPAITLQRHLEGTAIGGVLTAGAVGVYLSYFVVPHAVAAVLLMRDRDRFWRFLAASGVLFAIGVAAFALLPSAPPWMADPSVKRLVHGALPVGSADAGGRYAFDPNPVASMPSLHLGVTALLAGIAPPGRWRWLAVGYTVAMGVALVFTGEHYVLDVVAGALAAGMAWRAIRNLRCA